MPTAQLRPEPLPRSTSHCLSHLADLQRAHATLLEAMKEMDRVTREGTPDKVEYGNARWRIGRASLIRRSVWNAIHADLIGQVANGQAARDLQELATADLKMLRRSTCHVSEWTPAAIERNWRDYCTASRRIRSEMMACIGAEKRILYPMLQRCGGSHRH